ncbi:MAG: hypothetical protein ACOC2N_05605 [Spirochaetota bacterium]
MSGVRNPAALDPYLRLRERVTIAADRLFTRYASELQCRRGCYYCCDPITVLPVEIEAVRIHLLEHGFPRPARPGGPHEDRGETPEAILERDARAGVPDNPERRSVDRSPDGVFAPAGPESDLKRGHAAPPDLSAAKRCAFLGRAGECTVYEARPLICRTHGLPLAYRVYEYDLHGREVNADVPEYTDLWCDLNFRTLSDDAAPDYFSENGRINMNDINEELERLNEGFLPTDAGRRYTPMLKGVDRLPLGILLGQDPATRPHRPQSGAR